MSKSATLNWGILGCARITRRGLVPGIAGSSGSRLVALGSRNAETAREWAREFDVPNAHGSYEAVVADPDVQAVYIPLPNEMHREWVFRAADAGKHVLCEKPLALHSADALAMVEHCRSRGVLLMEAFMWRHQPRTLDVLKMVQEGTIGDLRLVRSSFSFPIDMNDWRLDRSRGGGALWDVGCYGVNTARLFAGSEPDRVRATAHVGPSGVDLSMAIAFRFPGDVVASIDCSFEQPFRCVYELVGTKGSIVVPDAYLPPDRPAAILSRDINAAPESLSQGAEPKGPETIIFDGRNQYAAMVDAFARSVADGKLVEPAEDGLAQMRVLDAILAAI